MTRQRIVAQIGVATAGLVVVAGLWLADDVTITASPPAAPTTEPAPTEPSSPEPTPSTASPPREPSKREAREFPPFLWTIERVTAEELHASWRPGCPVGVNELRAVSVSHWGFDGEVHAGRVIVAAGHAERVVAAFRDIYAAKFPIQRMVPVDEYGGSDDASMAANNTSAFNCRGTTGGSGWSEHSYGWAIDINPRQNPYVNGSTVLPPEGRAYTDRSQHKTGMIHDDDVVRAFESQGWSWGGYWNSLKDYQHFSATGH